VLDYYLLGKLPPPERRKDKDASGA